MINLSAIYQTIQHKNQVIYMNKLFFKTYIFFILPVKVLSFINQIFIIENLYNYMRRDNQRRRRVHRNDSDLSENRSQESVQDIITDEIPSFTHETDDYNLNVTYNVQRLKINLKDYADKISYQKTYYQDKKKEYDQIDPRVTLERIFATLAECPQEQTQSNYSQNGGGSHRFGQIVYIGSTPCYKVQKGGIITVYNKIKYQGKQEKREECTSILRLRTSQNAPYIEQVDALEHKTNLFKKRTYRKIKKLEEQLQKNVHQLNQLKKNTSVLINSACTMATSFQVCAPLKMIHYIGGHSWTQFIFNEIIPNDVEFIFKIKIVNDPSQYFVIGIVDIAPQYTLRTSRESNNAILYESAGGTGALRPGACKHGTGYKVGETVQVTVNLSLNTIKWTVGEQVRATHTHTIMGDKNRKFSPYVEVYHQGTSFQRCD